MASSPAVPTDGLVWSMSVATLSALVSDESLPPPKLFFVVPLLSTLKCQMPKNFFRIFLFTRDASLLLHSHASCTTRAHDHRIELS